MTRALAMEYIKSDIRINAIAPGGMKTAMTENWSAPDDIDFELMKSYTGFRGMAEPETAANAICWMASDEAARCTGSILSVDGGLTAAQKNGKPAAKKTMIGPNGETYAGN